MTLAELVDEYLEMHQAEPATIAKLRWLLGKATAALGEVRLAELSPKDVYAWRLTVPDGHRFEATQALRQVVTLGYRGPPRPNRKPPPSSLHSSAISASPRQPRPVRTLAQRAVL